MVGWWLLLLSGSCRRWRGAVERWVRFAIWDVGGMRDRWGLTEGPQVAMPLGAVLVLERVVS